MIKYWLTIVWEQEVHQNWTEDNNTTDSTKCAHETAYLKYKHSLISSKSWVLTINWWSVNLTFRVRCSDLIWKVIAIISNWVKTKQSVKQWHACVSITMVPYFKWVVRSQIEWMLLLKLQKELPHWTHVSISPKADITLKNAPPIAGPAIAPIPTTVSA